MKSTFSVIYYLKRQVVKKDGTVPVMGRITVDGSQTQFSCKLTVDPKLFIDHRTGCVLNGSRMGKELSANALQEHFTLPYAGQPPVPLSVPMEAGEDMRGQSASDDESMAGGVGLLTSEGPAVDAEEEAFIRAMQRKKKKKKRKGLGM